MIPERLSALICPDSRLLQRTILVQSVKTIFERPLRQLPLQRAARELTRLWRLPHSTRLRRLAHALFVMCHCVHAEILCRSLKLAMAQRPVEVSNRSVAAFNWQS